MAIEDVIRDAKVARAERAAEFGPVDHPHTQIHALLGIPFLPGERVLDLVTNDIVEVVGGGIENVSG